jgi:uncharacterized membrane protein
MGEHTYALFFLLLPFIVFLALLELRKKEYAGRLTFANGFRGAILICAITSVLAGVVYLIYVLTFEQERSAEIIRRAMESNEQSGMSQSQLQDARRYLEMTHSPFLGGFLMAFITLLYGVFISLACSGLLQIGKHRNIPDNPGNAAAS